MRKRDIQRFLETHRKFEFEMDKMKEVKEMLEKQEPYMEMWE